MSNRTLKFGFGLWLSCAGCSDASSETTSESTSTTGDSGAVDSSTAATSESGGGQMISSTGEATSASGASGSTDTSAGSSTEDTGSEVDSTSNDGSGTESESGGDELDPSTEDGGAQTDDTDTESETGATPPELTLLGVNPMTLTLGQAFVEPGAECIAGNGADLSARIVMTGIVDTTVLGSYTREYRCTDESGNEAELLTRRVDVVEAPELDELSFLEVTTTVLQTLSDAGADPVTAPFEGNFGHLNNDGCLDLFVTSHATLGPDGHYLQAIAGGRCLGTFVYQATDYRGSLGSTRFTSSVVIADFDNDGDQDIQGWDADGGRSLRAVARDGDDFEPNYVAAEGCLFSRDRCAFIDVDGDGVLEQVNGTSLSSPEAGVFAALYRQSTGDKVWSPADEPATAIPGYPEAFTSKWAPPVVADFNGDSWPDLAVYQRGLLFINDRSGGFTRSDGAFPDDPPEHDLDPSLSNVIDSGDAGINSNAANREVLDFDNDGDFDLFVVRFPKGGNHSLSPGEGIYLLENDGTGHFTDVAAREMPGIELRTYTYQTSYAGVRANDYDNNGHTDLMIDFLDGSTRSCAFLMNSAAGWTKAAFDCGFVLDEDGGHVPAGGGASKTSFDDGDYDGDGLLDIVASNAQPGPNYDTVSLHRNVTVTNNHYLGLFVRGGATREGWHARVTITAAGSLDILATRRIYAASQQGHTFLHAGVGAHEQVDIHVQYPHGGPLQVFEGVEVDATVVVYADGRIVRDWQPGQGLP